MEQSSSTNDAGPTTCLTLGDENSYGGLAGARILRGTSRVSRSSTRVLSDAEVAAGGLHGLVRLLAASHLEHVVVPNEADVFLHSWNPGLGLLLDAQYGPSLQGSLHEPANASLEKAASQALSIARCAQLASKRYAASMMHSCVARHQR